MGKGVAEVLRDGLAAAGKAKKKAKGKEKGKEKGKGKGKKKKGKSKASRAKGKGKASRAKGKAKDKKTSKTKKKKKKKEKAKGKGKTKADSSDGGYDACSDGGYNPSGSASSTAIAVATARQRLRALSIEQRKSQDARRGSGSKRHSAAGLHRVPGVDPVLVSVLATQGKHGGASLAGSGGVKIPGTATAVPASLSVPKRRTKPYWGWEDPVGSGNFTPYDELISAQIEMAYGKWVGAEQPPEIATVAGLFMIDFVAMEQRGERSRRRRKVRRLRVKDRTRSASVSSLSSSCFDGVSSFSSSGSGQDSSASGSGVVTWQWQADDGGDDDGSGEFRDYTPDEVATIESYYKKFVAAGIDLLVIHTAVGPYRIDFIGMEQVSLDQTRQRDIMRFVPPKPTGGAATSADSYGAHSSSSS